MKNSMEIIKTESQKLMLEIKESVQDELIKLADREEKGVLKMNQVLINKKPQF